MENIKFTTDNVNPVGTSLKGYVNIDYDTIVKVFGNPHEGDWDKTDAEWYLKFEDDKVATIYNYKTGINYQGEEGTPIKEIKLWNIGGFDYIVVDRIKYLLKHSWQECTQVIFSMARYMLTNELIRMQLTVTLDSVFSKMWSDINHERTQSYYGKEWSEGVYYKEEARNYDYRD